MNTGISTSKKLTHKTVDAFIKINSQINLKTFKFFKKSAVDQLNWSEDEQQQPELLNQLKAFQRLIRVTDDADAAIALYNQGLHSAYQIASMPQHQFIKKYADCFKDNSSSKAKQTYQKALARKSQSVQTYTAIAQQTAPYYTVGAFDNTSELTASNYSGLPSYEELFGSLDYCSCEECRSIFSPAAYFVDLMRLQADYVDSSQVAAPYQLQNRRPDLWNLTLSCENTNTAISKLLIVNEVLSYQYQQLLGLSSSENSDVVIQNLTQQTYPFNLPFDLPLTQFRHYLAQNKTNLVDIWLALNQELNLFSENVALATLGLSTDQWNLYSIATNDAAALKKYYGLTSGDLTSLETVDTFLAQTGLSYDQLTTLINEDLSSQEIADMSNSAFFINVGTAAPITIVDNDDGTQKLANLIPQTNGQSDYSRLDHIHRFIRLANAIKWNFTDLDWALRTIANLRGLAAPVINSNALEFLGWVQMMQTQKQLSVNQCCALIWRVKDSGASSVTFFDSIFNNNQVPNPPQWGNSKDGYNLKWTISQSSVPSTPDQQIQNALSAALQMSHADLMTIAQNMADQQVNPLPLTLANLSAFYRISLLSKILGLPINECLIAYSLLLPNEPSLATVNENTPTNQNFTAIVTVLVEFSRWLKTSGLSLAQLQYILTGSSYNATLQNQILGADACTNFLNSLVTAIQPTLCTAEQFNQAVHSLVQQEPSSTAFAEQLYQALVDENYIAANTNIVQQIPAANALADIIVKLLPLDTSAQNPYIVSLSNTVVALLNAASGQALDEQTFETNTDGLFSLYNLIGTQCLDEIGVVTTLERSTQIQTIMTEFFASIQDSQGSVLSTINYYFTSQQKTLSHYLASLYGISEQLVPSLEVLGGLSFGDYTSVSAAQTDITLTNPWAGVPLLQCLFSIDTDLQTKRLQYLQRYAYLFAVLSLSPAETMSVVQHPDYYGITYSLGTSNSSIFQFSYTAIQTLSDLKQFIQAIQDTQNKFLSYLDEVHIASDATSAAEQLSTLTGWDLDQLQFLLGQNWGSSSSPDTGTIQGVWQLNQWFQLAANLSVNVQCLWQLNQLYAGTLSSSSNYSENQAIANALWGGLTKTYTEQTSLLDTLQNTINQALRDALVPLVIYLLDKTYSLGINTADDLYEYLLIDVEVNGIVQASYVNEAISAVQLYIYRCLNNLETGVVVYTDLIQWWAWMENYRVWEANREVYLYPENYIEPDLRSEVTPEFAQLQNDLKQGDLTNTATVEAAFQNYMNGFSNVANLEIVGSALYDTVDPTTSSKELCLVGCTREQPYSYYYLTATFLQSTSPDPSRYIPSTWNAWSSISCHMNPVGPVNPVFAFGKWFVFWIEQTQTDSSTTITGDSSTSTSQSDRKYTATIYYSYLNFQNTWVTAQALSDPIPLPSDIQSMDTFTQCYWDRIYPVFFRSAQAIIVPYGADSATYQVLTLAESTLDKGLIGSFKYGLTNPVAQVATGLNSFFLNEDIAYQYVVPFGSNLQVFTRNKALNINVTDGISLCEFNDKLYIAWRDPSNGNAIYCGHLDPATDVLVTQLINKEYTPLCPNLTVFNNQLYIVWAGNDSNKHIYYGYIADTETPIYSSVQGRVYLSDQASSSTPAIVSFNDKLYILWTSTNSSHALNIAYVTANATSSLQGHVTLPQNSQQGTALAVYNNQLYAAWVSQNGYLSYGCYNSSTSSLEQVRISSTLMSLGTLLSLAVANNRLYISFIDEHRIVNYAWLNTHSSNNFSVYSLAVLPPSSSPLAPSLVGGEQLKIAWSGATSSISDNIITSVTSFAFAAWFQVASSAIAPLLDGIISLQANSDLTQLTITINTVDQSSTMTVKQESWQWNQLIINTTDSAGYNLYYNGILIASNLALALPADVILGIDSKGNKFPGVIQDVLFYNRSLTDTEIAALYNNGIYRGLVQVTQNVATGVPMQAAFNTSLNQTPVVGQPNWYIVEGSGAEFLVSPYIASEANNAAYLDCRRLNSTAIRTLSQLLLLEDIDGLLTVSAQETTEIPFEDLQPNNTYIPQNAYPPDTIDFGNGAMSQYYWEIFFHVPFLVAYSLNIQQQFEQAKKWYEYIFNPTVQDSTDSSNDKYWQFLGLRSANNPTLQTELSESWSEETQQDLTSSAELYEYHNDPFDPYAIAQLRPIAYQKTIVMHYIDNLIKWADYLFTQYTNESITEATMLYVLAYDLLGNQPTNVGACEVSDPLTLNEILAESGDTLETLPEFLIALEQVQGNASVVQTSQDNPNNYIANSYFCLPENDQFLSYWNTVEQRLYDIRNSLNINGVYQQVALFQPPLNPMQLVQQVVSGAQVGQTLASLLSNPPYYRFEIMVEKAKEITQSVIQLGQALLAALEKQDAEALSMLYSTNRQNILALDHSAKQEQIDAANQTLQSLQAGLQNAQDRLTYYTNLLNNGLSGKERAQIALDASAIGFQSAAQPIKGVATAAHLIPTIYGFSIGGFQPGDAVAQGANIAEGTAQLLSMSSNLVATQANYERRAQDWGLQQKLAQDDINQANFQIAAAQYQVSIAQQELLSLEKDLSQEQNVAQFLRSKFTSQQLYQWMIGKLSAIYFQAYQLAYDLATQAQQAWQFEKAVTQNFIQPGYWDSLHQGLLAGEALLLDIQRMENGYMKQNQRRFEIEKTISLNQLDSKALGNLISTGTCNFSILEKDFDNDYPGHYCRQIKTINLSFPVVLGPYQNIHATLTQTSNTVVLQPDVATVQYLLDPEKGAINPDVLRKDVRVNQQIALSQGLNDSGLFELNFNDPRYLPFEGTGAISTWQLSLPIANNPNVLQNLTDVIIRLCYTALPGSDSYTNTVTKML